jgi:penicillin-binding protein 1A
MTAMLRRLAVLVAVVLSTGGCAYQVELTAPPHQAESTKVFAADGTLITTLHAEQNRERVTLDQIVPTLRDAVLAIEDARFFTHKGVDLRALARALRRNAEAGEVKEGGSTITQQYVKNVLLDPEQTVHRKLREAVLAFQLERKHTKKTILEGYLNRIYLGNGAYGVQAAAGLYFNKAASDLTLQESALLAGLIQLPERYDPFAHPDAALTRRTVVLQRMQDVGAASEADVAAAQATPLGIVGRPATERYPAAYLVERVKRFVLDDARFGATRADRHRLLFEDGLRIHTTVDLTVQQRAEEAVKEVLASPDPSPGDTVPSGAVVVLDPSNGFVRALVGGRDFFGTAPEAKFDLATQGRRQSGSSFKPFVLAAALAKGIPLDRVYEAPASLSVPLPGGQPPWVVENYEGEGGAPENLVDATVHSVNTVYAQLIQEVGPQSAVELASNLGISSPLRPYASAVLGTNEVTVLDMASAYSTFAADGLHSDPVVVTEITRPDGSVLYRRPATRRRVLPAEVVQGVNGVLQQVVERGTGARAAIGRPVAGKTGTAQQWRDAWFVGYTPDLVTAVWVGFPDRQRSMVPPTTPMRVTGGSWPAEIWHRVMAAALAGAPQASFPTPSATPPPAAPVPPVQVPMPGLAGLAEGEARSQLTALGLVVTVQPRPSRDRAAGTVAEQTPARGTLVAPGSTVTLGISSGPPRSVTVPPLVGLTADEAARVLQRAGLVADIGIAEPPSGTSTRPGRVWKQSPAAGTVLDEGETTQLWARS